MDLLCLKKGVLRIVLIEKSILRAYSNQKQCPAFMKIIQSFILEEIVKVSVYYLPKKVPFKANIKHCRNFLG